MPGPARTVQLMAGSEGVSSAFVLHGASLLLPASAILARPQGCGSGAKHVALLWLRTWLDVL